ncbi:MAG TPA: peptidase, partial [Lachnospiraceae bacterium]|nr:peptidase [Lachnospiraceae bacterium]
AERDAQIALAEGKAKSIKLVYEAESEGIRNLANAGINQEVLQLKSIEALKDVSDGRATKIFVPNNLTDLVANIGAVGEALGIGDATPIDKTPKPVAPIKPDPCISPETSQGGKDAALTSSILDAQMTTRGDDNQ